MTDQDQSPEEIENRIKGKQTELRNDINALEEKMSPENMKAQARERMDEAKEQVKERAVDTTRQAGEAVREKIDDASERFRRGENMPSLSLLGLAAVIGIGLLLVRGSRNRHDEGHYTRHPDSDYVGSSSMPPARRYDYDRY